MTKKEEVDSDNEEVIMDDTGVTEPEVEEIKPVNESEENNEDDNESDEQDNGESSHDIQNLMKAMMQGMQGGGEGEDDDEEDEEDDDYEDEDEDEDEDDDEEENDLDIQELLMQYFENEDRQNIPTILSDIKYAIDNNSKCILKLVTEVRKTREDANRIRKPSKR